LATEKLELEMEVQRLHEVQEARPSPTVPTETPHRSRSIPPTPTPRSSSLRGTPQSVGTRLSRRSSAASLASTASDDTVSKAKKRRRQLSPSAASDATEFVEGTEVILALKADTAEETDVMRIRVPERVEVSFEVAVPAVPPPGKRADFEKLAKKNANNGTRYKLHLDF